MGDYTPLIIAGVILLVVCSFALALPILRGSSSTEEALPYQKEPHLLTRAERFLFFALHKAVGSQYHIFPKVRLIDIIHVRSNTPDSQAHKNRIMSKHIDFVLCTRDDFTPLLAIELDDSSHRSQIAQRRDSIKDAALQAASLPILRIAATPTYDAINLLSRINQLISSDPKLHTKD